MPENVKSLVLNLLADSPLVSEEVIADVRHLVAVGEEELAFRTLCSWLYEDALPISAHYHGRLSRAAADLGERRSMEKLDELVHP
ncbi:MafI family immunity protein [Amycolatopsis solani]|uniref:MafI family immunity protein n=1 Tax=Amycolatopsis solani TaxID=3028615 RepID=UPI0025B04D62|nr:MafI family immunity protein [Amycolatopsis sp. MEP2-6]